MKASAPVITGILLAIASAVNGQRQLAIHEPADGKIILSAWLDTENKTDGNDRNSLFNRRIGRPAGAFQMTQEIPLAPNPFIPGSFLPADMDLFDERTDASLFLTLYPNQGLPAVEDEDIEELIKQVNSISITRKVFIRYAPEMNGVGWLKYQESTPTEYRESFARIAQAIHTRTKAAMVWSPNLDQGGDSYTAYYPGDEHVDWVGLSIYYKGRRTAFPWVDTTETPPNFFAQIMDGLGGEGSSVSFYRLFAEGRGKPFVLSEGGAVTHESYNSTARPTEFNISGRKDVSIANNQMSFWNTFLFNQTFRTTYPLLKMANLFEHKKVEGENANDQTYQIMRDFRTTIDPASLSLFRAAIEKDVDVFQWANPLQPDPRTTAGRPSGVVSETQQVTVRTTVAMATTTGGAQTTVASRSNGAGGWRSLSGWIGGAVAVVVFVGDHIKIDPLYILFQNPMTIQI
ncbi:hypothetical protein HDU67_007664 [Dinochytrium kinnereticum]|nr:hypothetical protein HDU67_007664 [Dinochytrium kinnereticum]